MNSWLEEADLLIFDLDGTLYENTDHFDYLAEQIQHKLAADKQPLFSEQYEKIKAGEHPLTVGKAYDVSNDSILSIDPVTEKATVVQNWDGTLWPEKKVREVYPDAIAYDFENMVAVGDGWWLASVAGGHLGGAPEELYKAYKDTMAYMGTDAFQFSKATGLKEVLEQLAGSKPLVLMTNSGEADAHRILKELGLKGIFTNILHSAEKPMHTKELFKSLMERYGASPQKTVAVGDNFMNEIAPALALNMKAIYLQAYGHRKTGDGLFAVRSLEEVF